MKPRLIFLAILVVSLLFYAQFAAAQSVAQDCQDDPAACITPVNLDRDADGQNDDIDQCPGEAGPASNGGCPVVNDNDGDGTLNDVDQCPNEPGTAQNGGCPTPADSDSDGIGDTQDQCPTQAGVSEVGGCLPQIPTGGRCYIATRDNQRVNVRNAANSSAAVVDTLSPALTYPVLEQTGTGAGLWYRISAGWVAGQVVRNGGDCPTTSVASFPANSGVTARTRSAALYCDGNNVVMTWENLIGGGVSVYVSRGNTNLSYNDANASGIHVFEATTPSAWFFNIREASVIDSYVLYGRFSCPESEPVRTSTDNVFCGTSTCAVVWFMPATLMLRLRFWWRKRKAAKLAQQANA